MFSFGNRQQKKGIEGLEKHNLLPNSQAQLRFFRQISYKQRKKTKNALDNRDIFLWSAIMLIRTVLPQDLPSLSLSISQLVSSPLSHSLSLLSPHSLSNSSMDFSRLRLWFSTNSGFLCIVLDDLIRSLILKRFLPD